MQLFANRSNLAFRASTKAPRRHAQVVRAVAETEAPAKKLSPLERGGTLSGAAAAGKDAAKSTLQKEQLTGRFMQIDDKGFFKDDRWANGRWIMDKFAGANGETDWDKVIDAEIARRSLLESTPIPCTNEDPVLFDTAEIPWWAWVRRFHLPEAEKLNGRAAMVGYLLAGLVDLVSGAGLVDQQESFLGKLALHVCVFGILLVRSTSDLDKYKGLLDEATFYDSQWNATWANVKRPSEAAKE